MPKKPKTKKPGIVRKIINRPHEPEKDAIFYFLGLDCRASTLRVTPPTFVFSQPSPTYSEEEHNHCPDLFFKAFILLSSGIEPVRTMKRSFRGFASDASDAGNAVCEGSGGRSTCLLREIKPRCWYLGPGPSPATFHPANTGRSHPYRSCNG